jgi:hypothetical protein
MYAKTYIIMTAALAAITISSGCDNQSTNQKTSPQKSASRQEAKVLENTIPQKAVTQQEPIESQLSTTEKTFGDSRPLQPAIHTEMQLERLDVLTSFTTMIKTTDGWRKATIDEISEAIDKRQESQLKNREMIHWNESYATGSYKQSFQGRDVTGQVLDMRSVVFDDGTEQPAFILKGQFFVSSNMTTKGVKTIGNPTQFSVKEEVWKSTDGKTQIVLAEGTACLLVTHSAISAGSKEVRDTEIIGVLPLFPARD